MKKIEMIKFISKKYDVSNPQAKDAVEMVIDAIVNGLKDDGEVVLVGLGIFATVVRRARNGIDPRTLALVQVPKKTVIKFKATKPLREMIEGNAVYEPDSFENNEEE
jgi:DNA-binding protein HU-beta